MAKEKDEQPGFWTISFCLVCFFGGSIWFLSRFETEHLITGVAMIVLLGVMFAVMLGWVGGFVIVCQKLGEWFGRNK